MATNNDLLMDELHVSYFAQKLWLYVMIWLPRTTDNSTRFAQSLEIRGIESRLYLSRLQYKFARMHFCYFIFQIQFCVEFLITKSTFLHHVGLES